MSSKHLRLVYSQDTDDARNPAKWEDVDWMQLDLFPSEGKLDSVIFVNPIESTFTELLDRVNKLKPNNIIDIREIPNLSFNDVSREKFFHVLDEYDIHYLNFHKYMRVFHANSIRKVFESFEVKELEEIAKGIELSIKNLIEHGPTLVFTDTLPSDDVYVSKFTKALKRSNAKFSTYLCL